MENRNPRAGGETEQRRIKVSYHYHEVECPECGKSLDQVGCRESTCTTPIIGEETFVADDGYTSKWKRCLKCGKGVHYDFGDRPRIKFDEAAMAIHRMKSGPGLGDAIAAEWPGQDGLEEFAITSIREDRDGILCAVFGKDGVVGAEAVSDLILKDGVWEMK